MPPSSSFHVSPAIIQTTTISSISLPVVSMLAYRYRTCIAKRAVPHVKDICRHPAKPIWLRIPCHGYRNGGKRVFRHNRKWPNVGSYSDHGRQTHSPGQVIRHGPPTFPEPQVFMSRTVQQRLPNMNTCGPALSSPQENSDAIKTSRKVQSQDNFIWVSWAATRFSKMHV